MQNFEELHKKQLDDDVDDSSSNRWEQQPKGPLVEIAEQIDDRWEQLPDGPLVEIAEQIDDRWEQLPDGPLVEIAEHLTNFDDFEALHLVCHSWNSALRDSHCKFLAGGGHVAHCTFQVPWLLVAGQEWESESYDDWPEVYQEPEAECDDSYPIAYQEPEAESDNSCPIAYQERETECDDSCPIAYQEREAESNDSCPIADQEREAESNDSCPLKPCSTKSKYESNAIWLFFYRLSFDRVHPMLLRLPPELDLYHRCFYYWKLLSSHGWLFVVTTGFTMSLYNPLCGSTHNYIPLPENSSISLYAYRFTLSACPCTNSYTVMLPFSCKLAFWRPGDEDWTVLKPFSKMGSFVYLMDVTFYKGHFITVDNCGQLYMTYNEEGQGEKKKFRSLKFATLFPEPTYEEYIWDPWKAYFVLVESSQKLLLVVRDPILETNRDQLTVGFRVMEICVPPTPIVDIMDEDREQPLKEVDNLGNISLFVGRNQGFAVEVPNSENGVNVSPSYYGCKPNCIYFTDDRLESLRTGDDCSNGQDMGVYNMADGSIARHFHGESLGDYSPMLWV